MSKIAEFECPKCSAKSTLNIPDRMMDRESSWTCPACGREFDLCEFCREALPDIDDYGIIACNQCLIDNPDAKAHVNRMAEKERLNDSQYDGDV